MVDVDVLRCVDAKRSVVVGTRLPAVGGVYMFGKREGGMAAKQEAARNLTGVVGCLSRHDYKLFFCSRPIRVGGRL